MSIFGDINDETISEKGMFLVLQNPEYRDRIFQEYMESLDAEDDELSEEEIDEVFTEPDDPDFFKKWYPASFDVHGNYHKLLTFYYLATDRMKSLMEDFTFKIAASSALPVYLADEAKEHLDNMAWLYGFMNSFYSEQRKELRKARESEQSCDGGQNENG